MDRGTYVDLATLKDEVGTGGTAKDAQLHRLARRASRFIDNYCARHFFVKTATKQFRTKGGTVNLIIPDLYSIESITVDTVDLALSQYELEPLNEYPKTILRLLVGSFVSRQLVEIVGIWGYSEDLEDSEANCGSLDDSSTTVTPSSITPFAVGMTLKCEEEQMYVTAVETTDLTVERGANGTTAAAHSAKNLYIYHYPDPIVQACVMQVIRYLRGRDASWGDEVGAGEGRIIFREPIPAIRGKLAAYRRFEMGGV